MTDRTLSIDLEAVPTTPKPNFNDPAAWTVFAVGLSFRSSPQDQPESAVFIRRDGSDHACRRLLCAVANWVDSRTSGVLLSYNGDSFDLPVLAHCVGEFSQSDPGLAAHVHSTLDIDHMDLFAEIKDRQPESEKWPKLEESLAERSIPVAVATLGDRVVDGGIMPEFGRKILSRDGSLSSSERRALKRYSKSDVEPLHALYDSLAEELEGVKA